MHQPRRTRLSLLRRHIQRRGHQRLPRIRRHGRLAPRGFVTANHDIETLAAIRSSADSSHRRRHQQGRRSHGQGRESTVVERRKYQKEHRWHLRGIQKVPRLRRNRSHRRHYGQQRRLAQQLKVPRIPPRLRHVLHHQPNDVLRIRQTAHGTGGSLQLPRIQLHDTAGVRLSRIEPPSQRQAAARRERSVGQHDQRRGAREARRFDAAVRAHGAAHHDERREEDGEDGGGRGVAQCR
mmetsp:Transcript_38500/g.80667  ORF Transcript_38500/g.80667 Transcript_38500/m.80667 type:complete len:237 (-) Transcript_38500:717-1427(-)